MKAIVKETGDEICLSRTNNKDKDGYKVWWGEDGRTYFTHELNFLNLNDISCKNCEIDWEQRRYEFVKEILIASPECLYRANVDGERIVANAIKIADELIKQLKKNNNE